MWIPKTEAEIRAVLAAGELSETATFDAKRELPAAKKSINLAIDVAAMANDGGVLLYGIDQDEQGQPTILAPIALAGVRERIDNIVRSCITEPPTIEVNTIPTEADPSVGYAVVAVPPSPRAPHMVVKDRDYHFYGRSAAGNALLTEGEVARLYERRQRWEVDREAIIQGEIEQSPLQAHGDYGYLYIGVRPVIPDDRLLDRARERLTPQARDARLLLERLLAVAVAPGVFPTSFDPDMARGMRWEPVAEGFRVFAGYDEGRRRPGEPNRVLTFAVDYDGRAHLFCGRAAHRLRAGNDLLILEAIIAGLATRLLRLLGELYAVAGYLGPVDVGLAVTGLQDGVSAYLAQRVSQGAYFRDDAPRYTRDQYRRAERFPAVELLQHPAGAARRLTEPLYRVTSNSWYEPFPGQ
ncbi:MAG TPA: ATP-binding protein [Herpetosiphonaceae bacterium]|nr:ATP-binding protein [Herpetosiphonaceae bacterium]